MVIRCHHLGLVAGFALVLSLSAAADLSWSSSAEASTTPQTTTVAFDHVADQSPPSPAPVLLLAGGLFGFAAMVKWRQRQRDRDLN